MVFPCSRTTVLPYIVLPDSITRWYYHKLDHTVLPYGINTVIITVWKYYMVLP